MSHLLLYFANNNTKQFIQKYFINEFSCSAIVKRSFLLPSYGSEVSFTERLRKITEFVFPIFLRILFCACLFVRQEVHIVISGVCRIGNVYMNDVCERRRRKKDTKGNYVDSFYIFFHPKKTS